MVREISLAAVGLLDLPGVAAKLKRPPRTVQRWVMEGLIPAVVLGGGKRKVYLVRPSDLDAFTPPMPGRAPKPTPRKRRKP